MFDFWWYAPRRIKRMATGPVMARKAFAAEFRAMELRYRRLYRWTQHPAYDAIHRDWLLQTCHIRETRLAGILVFVEAAEAE